MPLRFYLILLVVMNVAGWYQVDWFGHYMKAHFDAAYVIEQREASIVLSNFIVGWVAFGDWLLNTALSPKKEERHES